MSARFSPVVSAVTSRQLRNRARPSRIRGSACSATSPSSYCACPKSRAIPKCVHPRPYRRIWPRRSEVRLRQAERQNAICIARCNSSRSRVNLPWIIYKPRHVARARLAAALTDYQKSSSRFRAAFSRGTPSRSPITNSSTGT